MYKKYALNQRQNRHSLIIFNLGTSKDFVLVISERKNYYKSLLRPYGFHYNSMPSSYFLNIIMD